MTVLQKSNLKNLVTWFVAVAIQSLSRVWLVATPWTTAHQAPLSFTISWSLSTESAMTSNHLTVGQPFFFRLQSFPESGSGGQSVVSSPSAWVLPVNIHDWFPLGLTGLSRVFSFKTSILRRSTFFMVQLSHPYTTTGKTIWAFVGKLCGPLLAKWRLCFLIAV